MRPLHAELHSAVPDSWCAVREDDRRSLVPWASGVELPPSLDGRFVRTEWGDWAAPTQAVANDRIWSILEGRQDVDVVGVLDDIETFSPSDPRFTLHGSVVRRRGALRRKVLEEVPLAEQFERFLPVLEIEVLGSADPKSDLRSQLVDDVPIVGWVDTLGTDRAPNDRQFVVRLRGDSMDGGKRPLVDGAWLIMEFAEAVDEGAISAVQLNQGGSYTVVLKRLFDEGQQIRLRSQNPEYEDVVFDVDSPESLKVVARFIQELPPPQRTRRPAPERLHEWLKKRLENPQETPGEVNLPPKLDGTSKLELTRNGLQWLLRIEPLPPFVDEVLAAEVPYSADLVRGRVGRLPTSPSTSAYSLAADPLTPLLKPFEQPGLPADRATVFRFDGDGRTFRKQGPHVRLGERVRLLLPPALEAPDAALSWEVGAWKACELEVDAELPPELGLSVATDRIDAHWETAPHRWRRLADGSRAPEFGREAALLHVSGVVSTRVGEYAVTTLADSQAMPAGSSWSISVDDVAPGEHAIEITPARTDVAPLRKAIIVTDAPPPVWPADVHVIPSGPTDLTDWGLAVRGPALWPVEAEWRGSRVVTRRLCIGADGNLPLDGWEIDTRALRVEPMGVLLFDFGELGARVVYHRRDERPEELSAATQRFVELACGADPLLVEKLAERLLGALGWSVRDGIVSRPSLTGGELSYEPIAVLCVGALIDDALKEEAADACRRHELDLVFAVAGTVWLHHAPTALFPSSPIDAAVDPTAFLRRFHWSAR